MPATSPAAPLLVVDDTLKALAALGRAGRARAAAARIVAVTGSVGKTSTKEALRAILSRAGRDDLGRAAYNNHCGVPLSLARLPRDARFGVFEIGMNHPGEIEPLARRSRPHVGVITTVEPAHIGHFGSVEAIADEKAEIFAGMAGRHGRAQPRQRALRPAARHARGRGVGAIVGFGAQPRPTARLVDARLRPMQRQRRRRP